MSTTPNSENARLHMAKTGCYIANEIYLKALNGNSNEFGGVMAGCKSLTAVFEIIGVPLFTNVNTEGTRMLEKLIKSLRSSPGDIPAEEFFGVASEPPLSFTPDQERCLQAVATIAGRNLEGFIRLVETSKEFSLASSLPVELAALAVDVGILPKYRASEAASMLISSLIVLPAVTLGVLYMAEGEELNDSVAFAIDFMSLLDPDTPEILPTAEDIIALADKQVSRD